MKTGKVFSVFSERRHCHWRNPVSVTLLSAAVFDSGIISKAFARVSNIIKSMRNFPNYRQAFLKAKTALKQSENCSSQNAKQSSQIFT